MDEMMLGGYVEPRDEVGDQGSRKDFDYQRREKPYEACFFLDSGGFKLLGNMDFSIERFGFKTTVKDILQLQTLMGGDIIASLDYPLAPVDYSARELRHLQERTIRNGISLLREISSRNEDEPQPLIYLAVHGIDYESARDCTERLLRKLDREELRYSSFGFAIGSLVPRRANRALIASIVKGVKVAIQEYKNGLYNSKPVHAFGISGDMVPTLAFLGVDTFDSNSFVQFGKNLRYVLPHSREFSAIRESRTLFELSLDELFHCNCRACQRYAPLLEPFKELSGKTAGELHQISGVKRKLIKSEIYAFLALHSLEIELREFDTIKNEIANNKLNKYVLQYAENTNTRNMLVRAYEAATGDVIERPKSRRISISLTRESFAIPETYKPPEGKEILLFIPCTKDKPYKKSRSHEAIRSALHKDQRIHIVTISGLYGPVPEELEQEPEIMEYDYMLSPQSKHQADFIKNRLVAYLIRYGNSYRQIFAYATTRAYREVARLGLKEYGRGILLPRKPRERTSKEFLKAENIRELQSMVCEYLEGSTFLRKQLQFQFE
jgi:tRNA-guanine family transglycosylase